MYYAIVNKVGQKLSGYYPNDCIRKLVYRDNDWYSFDTIGEAENFLKNIQSNGIGKNLKIREFFIDA